MRQEAQRALVFARRLLERPETVGVVVLQATVAGLRALGHLQVACGFRADALVGESVGLHNIFYCFLLAAIFRI
jgi:hypothetical protein